MAYQPVHNNTILLLSTLMIALSGCLENQLRSGDPLEQNLKLAGSNRPELEKVLVHYRQHPEDSLKLQSAIFLISNMENKKYYEGNWLDRYDALFAPRAEVLPDEALPKLRDSVKSVLGEPDRNGVRENKDLQHLSSSYLIKNIDEAFDAWQNAPWHEQVSFYSFCNYILPHKVYDEPPVLWRQNMYNRYKHLMNDSSQRLSMEDIVCAQVEEQQKWLTYSEELADYPGALSIDQILKIKKGGCIEWASFGAQAARAMGIPATIDYVGGHHWDALILSDTSFVSFLGAESRPGDHINIRESDSKFTKVYRKQTSWVPTSFAARAARAGIKSIPEFLQDPRITDVTAKYTRTTDLSLRIEGRQGTPVYLCVFKKQSFEPVAGSFIDHDSVCFRQTARREVYIPMYYDRANYIPAGPPVVLPVNEETRTLKSGEAGNQTMAIDRNYPFKRWMDRILMEPLISARFEGSNDPDFQHPVLLYEIKKTIKPYQGKLLNDLDQKDRYLYDSTWKQTIVDSRESFRYLRLLFNKHKQIGLGELEFYAPDGTLLTGQPIGNIKEAGQAFDGFPGMSIRMDTDTSEVHWLGLDLGKKQVIYKIKYLPAGDSHFIEDGKSYELFYWKNKWVSVGVLKAEGLTLEYKDVPKDGMYLLRCIGCKNNEVRPFTYEEGRQVWW